MQLTHKVPVPAPPDQVFALVNDVERVASCVPGATLEGQDGDNWKGRVTVKVGPITAGYAGSVRFLEVDTAGRRLRVQARGADTHGSGDAEAEVSLEVAEAPEGSVLLLTTDLVIRGKIAQFGKGAIATVSDRLLAQFARDLGSLLAQDPASRTPGTPGAAPAPAPAPAPAEAPSELGLSLIAGPLLAKYGPVVGALAVGLSGGWLLGRLLGRGSHALAPEVTP